MPGHEGRDVADASRLADAIGHVDREEVARRQKPVDRVEPDMVGIDEPGVRPFSFRHGGGGGLPNAGRLAADETVLAVRLVPNGGHDHARGGQPLKRGQLGLGLVGKPVTDAEGIPREGFHGRSIRRKARQQNDDS